MNTKKRHKLLITLHHELEQAEWALRWTFLGALKGMHWQRRRELMLRRQLDKCIYNIHDAKRTIYRTTGVDFFLSMHTH